MKFFALFFFGLLSVTLLVGGLMFLQASSEAYHALKGILLVVSALTLFLFACWGAGQEESRK